MSWRGRKFICFQDIQIQGTSRHSQVGSQLDCQWSIGRPVAVNVAHQPIAAPRLRPGCGNHHGFWVSSWSSWYHHIGIHHLQSLQYTSIAARGGAGSFKRLKLYNSEEHVPIESFVTTLIHWTFFSDEANKVGICWLCRSGQLHVTPSSRWSLPRCHRSVRNDMRLFHSVLQSSAKCYPSTILYYKVLLQKVLLKYYKVLIQYCSVLQSTTKYYSSTTPYCKVLQSTSPVILRTTKYYSSTTPYYKVLLQYYKVLVQYYSVLLRTTKYYKALQSTSPILQSTTRY